jgi:hypothetical protein
MVFTVRIVSGVFNKDQRGPESGDGQDSLHADDPSQVGEVWCLDYQGPARLQDPTGLPDYLSLLIDRDVLEEVS